MGKMCDWKFALPDSAWGSKVPGSIPAPANLFFVNLRFYNSWQPKEKIHKLSEKLLGCL